MGENLRSRGLNDPSAIVRLKISDVGAFCLGMRKQRTPDEMESRWDGRRCLDFGNDRRRLER